MTLDFDKTFPPKLNEFSHFQIEHGAEFEIKDLKNLGYEILVIVNCADGILIMVKNPPEKK